MKIEKKKNGENLVISLEGRLDTSTAPQLEAEIGECLAGIKNLTVDMNALDYISSAGLRVLLKAQKQMNTQGSMKVTNVNDSIMEVFDITGFTDILTVE
ncbi:MAG: STAS domain-containing protein [Porcipelethomonas sp.]